MINTVGGVGVAPRVTISGYNAIATQMQTDFLKSFAANYDRTFPDVVNMGFEPKENII